MKERVRGRTRLEWGGALRSVRSDDVAAGLIAILLFVALSRGFRSAGVFGGNAVGNLLIVGAVTSLVLLWFLDRSVVRSIPIPVTFIVLCGWIALSGLWSESPQASRFGVTQYGSYVLAVVLLLGVVRIRLFCATILWTVRFAIAVTLVVVALRPGTRILIDPDGIVPDLPGWYGLFPHKNLLGMFLAIAVITVLSFDQRGLTKYLTLFGAVILVIGSQSVIGITGTMVAVAAWGWMRVDEALEGRAKSLLRRATAIAVPASMVSAVLLVVPLAALWGKDSTFNGRTNIWDLAWSAWTESPLVGFGFDGIYANPPISVRTEAMWEVLGYKAAHAHNGILSIGVQLGWIGVAIFLSVWVSTFIDAVRLRTAEPMISVWIISLMVGQLYMSLGEEIFFGGSWIAMIVVFKVLSLRLRQRHAAVLPEQVAATA